VSTNTYAFYRDNGTSWDLIGGPGTGTITGSGANGQVSFWNGASTITGSNDLFWDATNGHLGVNTNVPGTALDVHHDQPTVAILNQTVATNDVRLGFQNNGVGLWRIGAFYNAGANDFGIYDAVAAIQPVTVKKTTGQVLIGTSTVGSGKLVVASATSDNGIQIVGATAPSLRIDSAETAPTKRIGLGIATALNNFIQGAVDRDMTIFNGSTTASPILFGIYDTTNVQEAARISAARNFIVGKTTDSGERLQIQGTANFSSTVKAGSFDVPNGNYFRAQQNSGGTYQVALGYLVGTNDLLLNFSDNLRIKSLLGSDLMTITSAGNVGIGNTSPSGSFQVSNNGYAIFNNSSYLQTPSNTGLSFGWNRSGGNGEASLIWGSPASTYKFEICSYASSTITPRLTIDTTGLVGIGTSSPTSLFHVQSISQIRGRFYSTGAASFLDIENASGSFYVGKDNSTGGDFGVGAYASVIWNAQSYPIVIATNNTERLRVTASTGNLLIGTTTDNGAKLQVIGNIYSRTQTIENTTNGIAQTEIVSNRVNSQGDAWWNSYTRSILATGSGTKLNIPFISQGNLNIVTVARVTVCSADYNSAFGGSAEFTFSVGSLNALTNLTILSSGGAYSSATTSGMNVVVTLSGGFTAAYVVIEYLTPVPSYSIDLGNITLTS
jgi:hypothetical protein